MFVSLYFCIYVYIEEESQNNTRRKLENKRNIIPTMLTHNTVYIVLNFLLLDFYFPPSFPSLASSNAGKLGCCRHRHRHHHHRRRRL